MSMPKPRGHSDALRPEIAASWQRAKIAGLNPDSPLDRVSVADIDWRSRLMVAAKPILDELTVQLADTALCLALADHECRIVDLRFTDRKVGDALEQISAIPGSKYTEDTSGTNSVATPFETRRSVLVNGGEHYLESLKAFSCYGQPILHPVTRRLEGVLDITGVMPQANPLFAPFVQRAVRDIEHRLLNGSSRSEQYLLAAFQAAAQRSRAVVVLGEGVVLTSPSAVDLLEAADHALLRTLAPDTPPDRILVRELTLSSGRMVSARMEHIEGTDGTLFQLVPAQRPSTRAVRRGDRAAAGAGAALDRELARLATTSSTVLIAGEPGSGRSTAVGTIAGNDPIVTLDATAVSSLGEPEWARQLEEHAAAHEGVLAVEDMQLLPPALAVRLSRLLITAKARIVLTSAPRDQLTGDLASLAACCVSSVELPPLRLRRAELPVMVGAMLAELQADRRVRFTPSALEALAAHHWPGNLRELYTVVRDAVRQRSSGDITVRDLPESHRGNPKSRTLTPWEQAEHDAIVKALKATSGNKAHAADLLGISRSTLYNRIRALRIAP